MSVALAEKIAGNARNEPSLSAPYQFSDLARRNRCQIRRFWHYRLAAERMPVGITREAGRSNGRQAVGGDWNRCAGARFSA
jgi:hypothetical protein